MSDSLAPVPEKVKEIAPPDSLVGKVLNYVFGRYPVWPVVEFLSKKSVPCHKHSFWYSMGSIVLFFLFIQFFTGVLLMVYYQPSQAWASVQRIVNEIPFGNLIRSIHHWSANLMVLFIFVHLFSAFFMKAHRRPREMTWVTGLMLLGISLFFGFSGYLLPWDELSFFATRVGVSEVEKMPVLGGFVADLMRGGGDIGIPTIGRFYTLHVVVLPLTLLGVLGLHLLFIQIQGVSEPDSFRALPEEKKKYHNFFTDYLPAEIPVWLFCFALVLALSVMFPRVLGPEADMAAAAGEGIKPEWYFLAQYQVLKLFPGKLELFGILLMMLSGLAVLIVPFIDTEVPTAKRGRIITLAGVLALLGFVFFTLWGWFS